MPPISASFARLLKATSPAVYFAPGSTFFARCLDLPAEIDSSEVGGFVELSLEDLSPFATEQLYYGYVVADNHEAVLVYAAYRRRFPPETTRTWVDQAFVVPDFLPLLGRTFEQDTTVFFESGGELTVMAFRAGRSVPMGLISRPAPQSEDEAVLAAWREEVRTAALERGLIHGTEENLTGVWVVRETSGSLVFSLKDEEEEAQEAPPAASAAEEDLLAVDPAGSDSETALIEPDEPPAAVTIPEETGDSVPDDALPAVTGPSRAIPLADLWTMDIRDPDFLAGRKQSVRIDNFIWRGVLGIAAALMILFAGEALLVSGKMFLGVMDGLTARRQGEVERIEGRQKIVERLAEFDRSNLIPFEMLGAINAPRPRSVYFTRLGTEGLNSLVIAASTRNVADVNQYEAALRDLPEVQGVEVRNLQPRDDETTFTLVVTFMPGAFEAAVAEQALQTASR